MASKVEESNAPQIARALRVNLLPVPQRKKRLKLMQFGKSHKLHIRDHPLHMVNILQLKDLLNINDGFHLNSHTNDITLHISSANMLNKGQGSQRDISTRFQCHTVNYFHI
jgi:hypothetical protein